MAPAHARNGWPAGRAAIRAGRTMQQAVDTIGERERGQWKLFDVYQRRNVTAAYAEIEWAQ